MTNKSDLKQLADDILRAVSELPDGIGGGPGLARVQDAMERLRRAIEPPYVFITNQRFRVVENIAVVMASEMGLFEQLVANEGENVTARDLASSTGYDLVLIARVMRIITCLGFADETGYQTYVANNITVHQNSPGMIGAFILTNQMMFSLASRIEDYLRTHRPCDISQIPPAFDFANGESCWDAFRRNPKWKQGFDDTMTMRQKLAATPWFHKYPIKERIFSEVPRQGRLTDSTRGQNVVEQFTIVDVGGNQGVDLQRFADSFPNLSCELILQDLPETINGITQVLDPRIRPMIYDFFTEQPVKGADVYYFKSVLHDWDDTASMKFLSNTAQAMDKHSRLLINDMVMSDTKEKRDRADMDMLMLFMSNGMERTHTQWTELLAKVSPPLRIVNIWTVAQDPQSVIEVSLID